VTLLPHAPTFAYGQRTMIQWPDNGDIYLVDALGDQGKEAPVRTPDWRARARYAFDNLMAKGTPALVGLLCSV
jgi:hypothetical protein